MRVAEMIRLRKQLCAEFEVIAIFAAGLDYLHKHASKHPVTFPVLTDPERTSYQQYEIGKSQFGVVKGFVTRINVVTKGLLCGYIPREVFVRLLNMPASFLID